MTREQIIRLAREAGFVLSDNATDEAVDRFRRFAALSYAAEQEIQRPPLALAVDMSNIDKDALQELTSRPCYVRAPNPVHQDAISAAVAAESEACAKACEEHPDGLNMLGGPFVACAAAIRARGQS